MRSSQVQRGQGMVEFALVGPQFLLLIFMIFEAALFVNAQATMDNATREGARAAALCGSATIYSYQGVSTTAGSGCSGLVVNVVDAHLGFLQVLPPAKPQVDSSCPASNNCGAGNPVQVHTDYAYTYFIPSLLGLRLGTHIIITVQEVSQQ